MAAKGGRKPPPLKPPSPPPAEEKAPAGVSVSDTGTLRLELEDGQHVAVRDKGVAESAKASNVDEGNICLLGHIRWDDLKIGQVIGEGTQAKVRKVKHKHTGVVYAMKSIPIDAKLNKKTLQQELYRVAAAEHPNVVISSEAFFVKGSLKILMEYMDLGTLTSIIKAVGPLPYYVLAEINRQILLGLGHLHANNIVHRDIKPTNLLVNSQGMVKIGDFGVSTLLLSINNKKAQTAVGSTPYMSPERARGESYDWSADIWSVGLTCATCALGAFPFFTGTEEEEGENPFARHLNMFDLAAKIADGSATVDFDVLVPLVTKHYPEKPRPLISAELCRFVTMCMQIDPHKRPSCAKLAEDSFIASMPFEVNLRRWLKEHGVYKSKEHSDPSVPTDPSEHSQTATSTGGTTTATATAAAAAAAAQPGPGRDETPTPASGRRRREGEDGRESRSGRASRCDATKQDWENAYFDRVGTPEPSRAARSRVPSDSLQPLA